MLSSAAIPYKKFQFMFLSKQDFVPKAIDYAKASIKKRVREDPLFGILNQLFGKNSKKVSLFKLGTE